MENTKIIQSLKSLDATELKRFREFVYSPFFNKHEKLRQLTDVLLESAPDFDNNGLSKKLLFKELFKGKAFNEQKVSDLMTYLYRLYERFLVQENFEADHFKKKLYLLKAFRSKQLDKQFKATLRTAEKNGVDENELSEDHFYNQYDLEAVSDLYFTGKDSRTKNKSIERKGKNLDLFYLTAKLKSCCEMINRQNIISERFEISMLDEIMDYVRKNYDSFETTPSILIYYQILLTLKDSSHEEHYHKLVELLEKSAEHFSQDEIRSMYDYAQNYCIKKINSGNTGYLNEIFKLYQQLLSKEIIFEQGHLSQWDYKNIVTVGSRLKEFDWTNDFIRAYKERLPEQEKENAYAYNLASLYYSQNKYKEALRLLQSVEFTDVYYGLGARSLLLKVYYESDEVEPLYSLFDSFKVYLKRNKLVSDYQYRVHMNLIKMTKRLTNINLKRYSARKETIKKELDKLKKRIEVTSEITNLNWLMEMVSEIEASVNK